MPRAAENIIWDDDPTEATQVSDSGIIWDDDVAEDPGRTIGGTLKDIAISTAKGIVATGEAAVGLADIPTFGAIGKSMEDYLGYDPETTLSFLDQFYSPAQAEAASKVAEAEGFIDTAKTMLKHPSTIAHSVVESAPQMLGGAAAARKMLAMGIVKSPLLAGAVGEGLVSAGSTAEGIRQQTEDGFLTAKQAIIPIVSGAGTTAFAFAGGRIAKKLGFIDVDTFLAGGSNVTKVGVLKRIIGGGITEGAFEELPQSMQEQIWLNAALDKPLLTGVGEAGATGILTGAAMGAGFNIFTGRRSTTEAPTKPTPETDLLSQVKTRLNEGNIAIDEVRNIRDAVEAQESSDPVIVSALNNIITNYEEVTDPVGPEEAQDAVTALEVFKTNVFGADTQKALRLKNDLLNQFPHLEDQANTAIIDAQSVAGPEKAEVPFMITRETEMALAGLGYAEDDIAKMKPEEALDIIEKQTVKPIEKEPVKFIGMQHVEGMPALPLFEATTGELAGGQIDYVPEKHEIINLAEYEKTLKKPPVEEAVPEKVEKYVWMANKEAGQKIGNLQENIPFTEEIFNEYVKPRLSEKMSFEEYKKIFPTDTHIAKIIRGDGTELFYTTGSLEELRPKTKDQKRWSKKVESFTSKEAIAWRIIDDRDLKPTLPKPKKPTPPEAVGEKAEDIVWDVAAKEEKVEIETTPEGKEVTVDLTKKEEDALTPKQQKEYLMTEIDQAIEEGLKEAEFDAGIEKARELEKARVNPLMGVDTMYTFEVPNDGTFEIVGNQLFDFQRRVKSAFPATIISPKFKPRVPAKKPVPAARYKKIIGVAPKELKPKDIDRLFKEVADTEAREPTGIVLLNPFQNWLLSQDIPQSVRDEIKSVAGKDYIEEARTEIEKKDIGYARSMIEHTEGEMAELQDYYDSYNEKTLTLKEINKETGIKRSARELEQDLQDAKYAHAEAVRHLESLEKPIEEAKAIEKPIEPEVMAPSETGMAWIKNQQKPIMSARKITKGKNKDKFEVILTKGRDKEGNIIPGAKKTVLEKEIIRMPEVPKYSTKQSIPESDITLKDVRELFKSAHSGISKDGNIWVRLKSGYGFQVKSVQRIKEKEKDKLAFEIVRGRMKIEGEMITGKFEDDTIEIARGIGDKWTLTHESEHLAEQIGLITSKEIAVLKGTIKRFVREGKFETENKNDIGGQEDRAAFIEAELYRRASHTGAVQRIFNKIADWIDSFVNLFKTTTRGIVREFETGKVFERELFEKRPKTTVPAYQKTAQRFYSQVIKTVETKMPEKMQASAVMPWLKKQPGIKEAELEWMGIEEMLEGKKVVTKDELVQLLRENEVRIEEVVKGVSPDSVSGITSEEFGKLRKLLDEVDNLGFDHVVDAQNAIFQHEDWVERWDLQDYKELVELGNKLRDKQQEHISASTKFSQWQLPGEKENYRELLFTLPKGDAAYISGRMTRIEEQLENKLISEADKSKLRVLYKDLADQLGKADVFQAGHWEEPNTFTHARINERVDADGNRILFIEELQSDWVLEGRRKGYKSVDVGKFEESLRDIQNKRAMFINEMAEKYNSRTSINTLRDKMSSSELKKLDDSANLIKTARAKRDKAAGAVPDMPFKKNWHEVALKRIVRMATEQGFDKVAWVTGQQTADRYDLSKQVNEVVASKTEEGNWVLNLYDKEDNLMFGRDDRFVDIPSSKLSSLVGKDLADKIIKQTGKNITQPKMFVTHSYKGEDLKVGGEWATHLYDKMIPQYLKKFGKKFGAEIQDIILKAGNAGEDVLQKYPDNKQFQERNRPTVHAFTITPELKRTALYEGLPLFATKKPKLPSFVQEYLDKAEAETVPPTPKETLPPDKEIDNWLSDTADISRETLRHYLPKNQPYSNIVEKIAASPEWYQHPVIKKVVRLFTRNRTEIYHQTFNYLNETEGKDAIKTLKDLKRKDLSFSQIVLGKTSGEYKVLLDMIEDGDINWERDHSLSLEDQMKQFENAWRKKGATDETIAAWKIVRENYDRGLGLMRAQMEDMLEKISIIGEKAAVKEIVFGEKSTKGYGKQFLADPDVIEKYRTVTHKTAAKYGLPSTKGVNYVIGKFTGSDQQGIQSINFKKELFDEKAANAWWNKNKDNVNIRVDDTPQVKELKKTLTGALSLMDGWVGFYAPRQRTPGDWAVLARKGSRYYREHRGSYLGAQRLAKKVQKQGWKVESVEEVRRLPESVYQDIQTISVAEALKEASSRLSQREGMPAELTAVFNQELLEHISDIIKARGYRASMIHRGKSVVEGYNQDPLERTVIYNNNLSSGIAKAKIAELATKQILGDYADGKKRGGISSVTDKRAFEVATTYLKEQLRNMDQTDRLVGLAKSITTFKYLGFNLRSLGVNLTAVITTAPAAIHQYAMQGKGSILSIPKELVVAGKDYARYMAGHDLKDSKEQAFMEKADKLGYNDPQYTREALGHLQRSHQKIWPAMMDASMYLFGKSEQWNRGTTALAGYRLARKQGINTQDAMEGAKNASDRAHGIYGKATLPIWAQGKNPFAKIGQLFYIYSKFGHNYVQMCYDLGTRKHNIKAFAWAVLSPLVLAGGSAFPFKEEIFAFFGGILRALGIHRDPEKWVWDTIRNNLGGRGEVIARHGVTGIMGVDISGSLSVGIGIPKGLADLTGAAGGVVEDIAQAGRFLKSQQYRRAAEKIIPRGAENVLRGLREKETGLVTQRGKRLWTPEGKPYMPSKAETAVRVLGFRSATEATLSERTWEAKKEEKSFADRKSRIYEMYRAYLANPKTEKHKEIRKLVTKFNKDVKGLNIARITYRSMKLQAKRMRRPTKREAGRLK